MVQVRFAMYLDKGDYKYDEHLIEVPVMPEEGYQGEIDEHRMPADIEDYKKWIAGLPTEWQNNPFHNHFIYVEPDTTDKEIMDMGEAFLHEAYIKWASDQKLDLVNQPVIFPATVTSAKLSAIDTKIQSLKSIALERKI